MSFRLTQKAEEDLINIAKKGLELFGERQARFYHNALFDLFGVLSENPKMARERSELSPPVRVHPFKTHVVIYQIEGDDILIIRVHHGREDWLASPVAPSKQA